MNTATQIAKHFREVHFGGNWTTSSLKEHLADVSWQQATTTVAPLNTIAALLYHANYYVAAVLKVLRGEPLQAHDKYSFDAPSIQSAEDWNRLLEKTWRDAEHFATLVEQLPAEKLSEPLADEKYGSYYRNLHGIIEHTHYHLGQIVLIKKLLLEGGKF